MGDRAIILEKFAEYTDEKGYLDMYTDQSGVELCYDGDTFYIWTLEQNKSVNIKIKVHIDDIFLDGDGYMCTKAMVENDARMESDKTIWKYILNREGRNVLEVPFGYKVLSVINQYDQIVLYCMVNPTLPTEIAHFYVIGTGWDLHPSFNEKEFLGTVSTSKGALIWHIFKD